MKFISKTSIRLTRFNLSIDVNMSYFFVIYVDIYVKVSFKKIVNYDNNNNIPLPNCYCDDRL